MKFAPELIPWAHFCRGSRSVQSKGQICFPWLKCIINWEQTSKHAHGSQLFSGERQGCSSRTAGSGKGNLSWSLNLSHGLVWLSVWRTILRHFTVMTDVKGWDKTSKRICLRDSTCGRPKRDEINAVSPLQEESLLQFLKTMGGILWTLCWSNTALKALARLICPQDSMQ